ncbi:MAG TPA: hypothetical protein PKD53_15950 [Chloroflexaceae bacterium]|nr:hypothetical protein [Chloroflexaceae bacterium]
MAKKQKPSQVRKGPPPQRPAQQPSYKAPILQRRPPRVPGR